MWSMQQEETRKIIKVMILYQIIDLFSTIIGIKIFGLIEKNPLLTDFTILVIIKTTLIIILMLMLKYEIEKFKQPYKKLYEGMIIGIYVALILYVFIVSNNLSVIIHSIG